MIWKTKQINYTMKDDQGRLIAVAREITGKDIPTPPPLRWVYLNDKEPTFQKMYKKDCLK